MEKKTIYIGIDRNIIDSCYADDPSEDFELYVAAYSTERDAKEFGDDLMIVKKEMWVNEAPCIVETPQTEPLSTHFGGTDKEWNEYLSLRRGDKCRFKKSSFDYRICGDREYVVKSDGVFSMGGTLCAMFDGLGGAYSLSVFDVVKMDKNKNIFEGVKFGDKFKTRDGRVAIFYSVCEEDDGYNFIIEPSENSVETVGTDFHFVDKNGHWHRRDDIDSENDIIEKF